MEKEKRFYLLGTYLDPLSMQETLARIEQLILIREPVQHVAINAGKINLLQRDAELRSIINECSLISADGQAIVWAAKFLNHDIPERVAGIDLFQELVRLAAEKSWRVYYFGAKQTVVQKVVSKHQKLYPNLQVAGFRNGYFEEESEEIAAEIRASRADILFVGFSSPKKEFWIHANLEKLHVPFVMGVGGSFDVIAGKTKRAPLVMQKAGLEWFYRFLQEPRRMAKRYLIGNAIFLCSVLKEKWRMERKK
ncbi:WecB/TagA/CpsF family glycosyltransferase [Listeria kieliensis]|uniref:UDP-N-acetyl-D-mannosamine transferase n=1 Tax=Listeria kieliensis TaxID=1621700 RepID=A0A3D8TT36_9LIST|nr:WecB/TagA/CpsF family glycosyltransferase [Listeria kieliensis]RDX02256.1 UDP-N-acetyl-D-mannosamine transferase [Listeria kieliensis]